MKVELIAEKPFVRDAGRTAPLAARLAELHAEVRDLIQVRTIALAEASAAGNAVTDALITGDAPDRAALLTKSSRLSAVIERLQATRDAIDDLRSQFAALAEKSISARIGRALSDLAAAHDSAIRRLAA